MNRMHCRGVRPALLAGVISLTAILPLGAGQVVIEDRAGLLSGGEERIRAAAQQAPFDVRVITRNDMPDKKALDDLVDNSIRQGAKKTVALGVDPKLRHLHIAANDAYVNLNDVNEAQRMAGSSFKAGDWSGGVVAAINDLAFAAKQNNRSEAAATARRGGDTSSAPAPAPTPTRTGGGLGIGSLLLLAAIGFFLFRFLMGRRRNAAHAGTHYPHHGAPMGHVPPGGQSPGAGYGGYGHPGGHDPGYYGRGRGSGMGGGLMGGLGGGLLGYMLGRHHGGNQPGVGGGGGAGDVGGGGDHGGFISGDGGGGDFGGGDAGGGASSDSGDF